MSGSASERGIGLPPSVGARTPSDSIPAAQTATNHLPFPSSSFPQPPPSFFLPALFPHHVLSHPTNTPLPPHRSSSPPLDNQHIANLETVSCRRGLACSALSIPPPRPPPLVLWLTILLPLPLPNSAVLRLSTKSLVTMSYTTLITIQHISDPPPPSPTTPQT